MDKDLKAELEVVDALLPLDVYECLFAAVVEHKPSRILEIGTAHGAGTIAMALGAQSVNLNCMIDTVDTLRALPDIPSSRQKYGTTEDNVKIVQGNFARAGVDALIRLFVGRSDVFAVEDVDTNPIEMLVLDADGRIDRDLLLFHAKLADGAVVVIDDVDGHPKLSNPNGQMCIDLKHVISSKLLARYEEKGYLTVEKVLQNTAFCKAVDPASWNSGEFQRIALETYHELVFTPVSRNVWFKKFLLKALATSTVGRVFYRLYTRSRRLAR